MSLAAIVPVGNLGLHGYQHTARQCIASACAAVDRVYLVSSVREDGAAYGMRVDKRSMTIISDERTWFARKPDGSEWFDAYRVMENVNIGLEEVRLMGFDYAVCLMCNWFLPAGSGDALRRATDGGPWGWVYKREHLAGQMFHANKRIPFVVRCDANVRFTTDALECDGTLIPWEDDLYTRHNTVAAVDMQYELTVDDLKAKIAFIRNYRDVKPSNAAEFRLTDYLAHHRNRFHARVRSNDAPEWSPDSRPVSRLNGEFVSRLILEGLG